MFTRENLAEKSNQELCEIVVSLGGVAPSSGKFRTRAAGIDKVLTLQKAALLCGAIAGVVGEPVTETTNETPTTLEPFEVAELEREIPESKLERLERLRDAATDPALIRRLRKKIRRITQPAARARRAQAVFARRSETSKKNRQRAEKLKKQAAAA